jgi:alpha-beta hydrolase superfamily lysophospholipase
LAEAAVKYTTESFTASDGYRWCYRRYDPRATGHGEPRAQLVCLHGIQSHAGWYDYSSSKLCQAGYGVHFLDRRGSGMNQQDRGDAPGFRQLLDDVHQFIQMLWQISSGPVFLVGISWGGKLALALQRAYPAAADGIALLCPGIFPRVHPSLGERLAIGLAWLVAPQRRFRIPLSDPQLFTASPRWQEFIREDQFSLHEATARLLVESVRLDRYVRSAPAHMHIPVLLMLAERDRIIDNRRTRQFVERFGCTDKTIVEYAGAEHTLEFEPKPDIFIGELLHWLERHI